MVEGHVPARAWGFKSPLRHAVIATKAQVIGPGFARSRGQNRPGGHKLVTVVAEASRAAQRGRPVGPSGTYARGTLFRVGWPRLLAVVTLALVAACSSAGDTRPNTAGTTLGPTTTDDTVGAARTTGSDGEQPSTSAPTPADEALRDLANCTDPCVVTGRIPVDHPRWGQVEIVTFGPRPGTTDATCDHKLLFAIDDSDTIVWDPGPPDPDSCPWYAFGPAGTQDHGSSISNAIDRSGRIFLDWNPGRYNGVSVLVVTPQGFDDLETLPLADYATRFYGSTAEDTDGDGDYEIVLDVNSCYLSCAGGPNWITSFSWNGSDFAPRPEATPTACGHYGIWEDEPELHQVAELRDITVQDTTCFEVVSADEPFAPAGDALVDTLVRAHDQTRAASSFQASGWRCEVTNPGSDGARYACSGAGTLTFTRHTTFSR